MAYADWYSGTAVSTSNTQHGFVCMSTVDDLSYSPTAEEKSRDVAQIAATGRRSWKTLRGKGEAVWPPSLEAALIEALHKYQPDESRPNSKSTARFPMRNRYISDYVFEKTGKRRTPKQVGSRLQQLRDTCKESTILELISRRQTNDFDSRTESSHSPSYSSRDLSVTPPLETQNSDRPNVAVYVNVSVQQPSWPPCTPRVQFISNDISSPHLVHLSTLEINESSSIAASSRRPSSILHMFSSSMEFSSPWPLVLESTFSIYREGSNKPIHEETAPLQCLSSPMQSAGWVYGCELVPEFWKKLCYVEDPNSCTIVQLITPTKSSHCPSLADAMPTLDPTRRNISIIYRFSLPDDLDVKSKPAIPPLTGIQSYELAALPHLQPSSHPTQWYPGHQQSFYTDMPGYSLRPPPLDIPLDSTSSPSETPTQHYHPHNSLRGTRVDVMEDRQPPYEPSRMMPQCFHSEPRTSHLAMRNASIPMGRRDPMAHTVNYASCYS